MNKKYILLIPVILGLIMLPMLSAAIAWQAPAVGSNNTGTVLVNCSFVNGTDITDPIHANTSFYYNGSGTWVNMTITGFQWNISNVWGTATLTGLTDSKYGAFNCTLGNDTDITTGVVRNVVVDNTAPVITLQLESESIQVRDSNLITWSITDATSGVYTYSINITTPDSSRCPTIVETTETGNDALVDDELACPGTYTVQASAQDYAGNIVAVTSKTFKASLSGLSKSGSNTLGGIGKSSFSQGQEINSQKSLPLGEQGTNVAIIIILAVGLWYFLRK